VSIRSLWLLWSGFFAYDRQLWEAMKEIMAAPPALSKHVRQIAEEWAVDRDLAIRWYHTWLDGDRWMVTAYAQDAKGAPQVITTEAQ
jgi:hypothetical protein